MSDFHFLRPYLLLLSIPFLLLMLIIIRKRRNISLWSQICSKELIPYMLAEKVSKHPFLFYFSVFLTLALLLIGFAGPTWQSLPQPLIKSHSGLVILLDLSPAMDAEDLKPSRLKRAIYKISDFLDLRKEGLTALVVFSGDPFVVTPLTDDIETIKALLPVLDTSLMPSSGHRVANAISKAAELFAQAGFSKGSILLITSSLSASEIGKAAESATQGGISLSVLGVGTEENAPIPQKNGGFIKDDKGALVIATLAKENLTQLAKMAQGVYVTMTVDDSDIKALADQLSGFQHRSQEEAALKQSLWHDQGYLLVALALPLFCLLFRRGVLLSICIILPHTLQAALWDTLFKTPDQQAEELFHQENYQQAKELFQNREWLAATNFRLKDYEASAKALMDNHTPEGLYNFGTAKAKQGDFESALKAYQEVLEKVPDHVDALHNKKLIEDWLQQQQQEKQDQQQNQDQSPSQEQNQQEKDDQESKPEGQQQPKEGENQSQTKQKGDQQQNQSKEPGQNFPPETRDSTLQEQHRAQMDQELELGKEPPDEGVSEEISQEEQQRQMDDRWLQRIPDDPGGLLRRKFLYQYRNQKK